MNFISFTGDLTHDEILTAAYSISQSDNTILYFGGKDLSLDAAMLLQDCLERVENKIAAVATDEIGDFYLKMFLELDCPKEILPFTSGTIRMIQAMTYKGSDKNTLAEYNHDFQKEMAANDMLIKCMTEHGLSSKEIRQLKKEGFLIFDEVRLRQLAGIKEEDV